MASARQRISEMVRAAISEDPEIKNRVLLDRAREIAPEAVEGLTLPQFHGKFRLPVARALSAGGARGGRRRSRRPEAEAGGRAEDLPGEDARRDAIRDIFRRFAVQLARAEGRSEVVRAAARIDEFVEEVLRTAQRAPGSRGRSGRKRTAPSASSTREARTGSAEEAAASADSPGPAVENVGAAARDMRPRRRPRAALSTSPAGAPAASSAEDAAEPPLNGTARPEPAIDPAKPVTLALSHELEEFRRSRSQRERGRRPPR